MVNWTFVPIAQLVILLACHEKNSVTCISPKSSIFAQFEFIPLPVVNGGKFSSSPSARGGLWAFIYHLFGPVDIFDPRAWLKWVIVPKTTKIGYKLLPLWKIIDGALDCLGKWWRNAVDQFEFHSQDKILGQKNDFPKFRFWAVKNSCKKKVTSDFFGFRNPKLTDSQWDHLG